jgi:hypothetical protein
MSTSGRHSLEVLTTAPPTDRRRHRPTWPTPPHRLSAPGSASRSPRRDTRALPVDPGRWGRPAAVAPSPLPPWVPVGAPPPPPGRPDHLRDGEQPRVARGLPPKRAPRRRWSGLGLVVEMAVALSILLTVALASVHHGPRQAAPIPGMPPTNPAIWTQRALPIVVSLVDDVRAAEADTVDPAHAVPARLHIDDSRLRADVAAAQGLEPSPESSMKTIWASTVTRLSIADRALHAAATDEKPAAIALAHQLFDVTGESLLRIGRAMTPPS